MVLTLQVVPLVVTALYPAHIHMTVTYARTHTRTCDHVYALTFAGSSVPKARYQMWTINYGNEIGEEQLGMLNHKHPASFIDSIPRIYNRTRERLKDHSAVIGNHTIVTKLMAQARNATMHNNLGTQCHDAQQYTCAKTV